MELRKVDCSNASIVRAVVAMANSLGMVTTAEGAETAEQIAALRKIGCDQAQGFAFGMPMDFEAATALISFPRAGIAKTIFEPRGTRVSMLNAFK